MIDYLRMIREFHEKYEHYTSNKPAIPDDKTIDLRYRLIEEELLETLGALRDMMNFDHNNKQLIELADGIADCMVVLLGTALAFGIPIDEVFAEVHRSNMTKSFEKNEYGKTIKGDAWEPPKIREILERHMK